MGVYVDSIKTSDGSKHPIQDNTIFTGTREQWDQLTTAQKQTYRIANFTDDLGSDAGITDAVTDGDMRAVTSNAVHDALINAGVPTFTGTQDEWNQLTTEQKLIYEIVNITDDYDQPIEEPVIWGFIDHMNILDPSQRIEYIKTNKNYTPLSISSSTHTADYGSWEGNPILEANVPAMIKANGTVDYYLDPDDYTKKLDGTASDVANTAYEGGAFAYIPKVYKREYIKGNDRYVMFSMTKVNNDFKPVGFVDHLGNEYDGIWIPMFNGTKVTQNGVDKILSIGTGTPINSLQISQEKTFLENSIVGVRFFGGAIVNVLYDLLVLFSKNSVLALTYGYGTRSCGANTVDNAVVNGGQFYGTFDGLGLNKALHSTMLLTNGYSFHDPYTNLFNGRLKISHYYYDLTGETEYTIDTGHDCIGLWSGSPARIGEIIPDYGMILDFSSEYNKGSEFMGYGVYGRCNGGNSVCSKGNWNGGSFVSINLYNPTYSNVITALPMVFGELSQQLVGGV